jgi:type II secretory pathway pseudopilin PulG
MLNLAKSFIVFNRTPISLMQRHKGYLSVPRAGQLRASTAFSVVELMVAISIMGLITFALFTVFNQTQRALRSTEAQSDVSEKARAIIEMIGREVEQTLPTYSPFEYNLAAAPDYPPMKQTDETTAPGAARGQTASPRTNVLYNIFFQTRETNAFKALGYRIISFKNGVGILERFQTTNRVGYAPISNAFYTNFLFQPIEATNSNYHHVADGVIHFRISTYDPKGYKLAYNSTNVYPPAYTILRRDNNGTVRPGSDTKKLTEANVVLAQGFGSNIPYGEEETSCYFLSNALPAFIEIELGVLEPEALKQYYTMLEDSTANPALAPRAQAFLAQQINRVHLFRKRIALPTAAQQ